ncbi:MAG: proton-conducting transporter membrane subunit [Kiritimatiellae bacterium]|nr:proton-conducting transporter membrane subunit [Kiritimatiellia bacterium]
MNAFLAYLLLMITGGIISAFTGRRRKLSAFSGAAGLILGSLGALTVAIRPLINGRALALRPAWPLPLGSFAVEIDSLSGFFLCVIFSMTILCALYGWGYNAATGKNPGDRSAWLWLSLLAAGMALVVVARNAVLFLLAWELMSLSSFFLVAFENGREKVRRAAWTYLVATHLGTAFLLAMFVLMGAAAGSFDFAAFAAIQGKNAAFLNLLFILALIGFGTKAGFYPLHVWLPEAHPAAPSHVSALMSGVMIKTGIYAMIRFVAISGPPPAWWGWLLVLTGAVSGILGVVFALAQHDLKRLLAYHSVENIGIIALGFGLGLIGWSCGSRFIMLAGFAGSLLHVANHAIFKGLLFLSAGSVLHAVNCRNMEKMGGLLKVMPVTGAAFLAGSAAISGLPPLNGFVSEFLIYTAALLCVLHNQTGVLIPGIAVIGSLALIGGLAAACFAKACGVVFLGEPRSPEMQNAHECGLAMRLPMLILSAACLVMALAAPFLVPALCAATGNIAGIPVNPNGGAALMLKTVTFWISAASLLLIFLLLLLAILRICLFRGRSTAKTGTWDCGFAQPSPRMQYTASSFAQPITNMFRRALDIKTSGILPEEFFPGNASFSAHADDTAHRYLFAPVFRAVDRALACLRWIQEGRVQIYVLYINVILLILLLFAL